MSLNYLELRDVENLVNLLLRSQQSKAREALCIRIGIEPYRLSFIRDSSDSDFFLQLIEYLDRIDNKESLCKLCCEELFSIFCKSEIYAPILRQIVAKIDCNQKLSQNFPNNKQPTVLSSIPVSRVSLNPFNQPAKNKLIIGSAIFLIGLAGFSLYNQNSNSSNNPHSTEQYVSETPNLSPTANSEESVNKINSIYQKVLGREPTMHEQTSNVKFLEAGGQLSSIRDWIAKTSSLLREGNVISLECQGDQRTSLKWLDFRIKDGTVRLAPDIDAQTKWKVHVIGDGVVALENHGKINGSKWLNGVTYAGHVNLASNTEGDNTGTKWKIHIIDDGFITLENQGKINGSKWLNGVTYAGHVDLAPNTEGGNTGTKWKIVKQ